jgi:DNA polymerase
MGVTPWVTRKKPAGGAGPAGPARSPAAMPAPPAEAPAADPAGAEAGEIERMDWAALESTVRDCRRCGLHEGRTQAVSGVGHRAADWLIVGEAPGEEEDRRGEPFVGRAGQLLDAMLAALGLSRETAYIANVLKCRPPGNRDPRPEEASRCAPFLDRQIALLQPKLILAVGRVAAQRLLGTDATLARMRNRVHHYGDGRVPVVVTYHPAYLLRRPSEKGKAWRDLLLARRQLGESA